MRKMSEGGKKVLFMMLLLVVVSMSRASDTTYVQFFDLYSSQLDRTEMKTSILHDRVISFAGLNKQNEASGMQNNFEKWKQIYLELYNSDYENKEKENLTELLERIKTHKKNTHKTPIGVINYEYEYLDTNAERNHAIELINNKLIRRKDISVSPFILDSVTALAFLTNKLQLGLNSFVFDSSFVLSNKNFSVTHIDIDFKEHTGSRTLSLGDTLDIIFPKAGDVEIKYAIHFSNGDVFESVTTITVTSIGTPPCDEIPVRTSTLFSDYEGHSGPAELHWGFYYNDCVNKNTSSLLKPIIILDGFDPGDNRSIPEIYDSMNGAFGNFADEMRAAGHDIIICNFDNGDDFIERNATGLIELLVYVKNRTTDKIIVIGPSMGGLIARYALAKMEKENIDHQTCLYISIDAPHQGANIPMGDQFFLYFFGEVAGNAAALEGLNKIKSPAAREMLIDHYIPNTNYPKYDEARYHLSLNTSQNSNTGSNGYPLHLRKIALSNGSINRIEQGIAGKLFSMEKHQRILFLGKVKIAEAQIYASPSRGTSQVAYVMAANPSNILSPYKKRKYASVIPNNPHPSSLDNSPGGLFNTQDQLTSPYGYLEQGFQMEHKHHSFIPTVSSLDINYPDTYTNYLYDPIQEDIICNKETPFDAYFAPTGNEPHVHFSSQSVNWLRYEIYSAYKTVEPASLKQEITGTEIFNYGVNTKEYYSRSFTVKEGGLLGINMNRSTGYHNEAIPTQGSSFTVKGYNNCSSTLQINIENKGKLIIGDTNGNVGEFRISDRTQLNLLQDAQLIIHNHSKLIIERGSKLIIGPNTQISLEGDQAQIIIEGDLVLLEHSNFSFSGAGFISFRTNNIAWGIGSSIVLEGSDINDKVLEIANGKVLIQPYIKSLFKVRNGSISFSGPDAYINSAGDIDLVNVQLRGGKGLVLNGQENATINGCVFYGNTVGITNYATNLERYGLLGYGLNVLNCSFYNNEIGIKLFGRGYVLQNINMTNCLKGVVADGVDMPSELMNSVLMASQNQIEFPANTSAINHIGTMGASLNINNTSITKFNTGVYTNQSTLNLKCNEITLCNYIGVWAANDVHLNLSSSTNANAGNNTISVLNRLNNKTVFLEQANAVNIYNGTNKFKIASGVNNYFIAGTMKNLPVELHLQKNNWYTSITSNVYLTNPSVTNFIIQRNTAPSSDRVKTYYLSPVLGSATELDCSEQNAAIYDPCYDPSLCKDNFSADPLVYAPHAPIVKLKNYSEGLYNYVLKVILNDIKADVRNVNVDKHFKALVELYCLANHEEYYDMKYLSDLTYESIIELYYKAMKCNMNKEEMDIAWNTKTSGELLFRVQTNRVDKMTMLKDSSAVYYTLTDIAQLMSIEKEYSISINYLKQASDYIRTETEYKHNEYWLCTTTLKNRISKEEMTVETIDSLLATCTSQLMPSTTFGRAAQEPMLDDSNSLNATMRISPNPSKDFFDVCLNNETKIHQVLIYDMQGRLLRNDHLAKNNSCYRLNNIDLMNGLYYIQVVTEGQVLTDKILIDK